MRTLHYAALALCGAILLPAAAQNYTAQAALERLFVVEGKSPYPAPYAGTLNFSALESKYDSGHGHGYRNEMKIADALRVSAAQTREHFAARVTAQLANGAKTIIAQYHVEGLDTILKVYLQDSADNGVFDILVRILGTDGKEATTTLGAVRSGESFDLDIVFAAGQAQVKASTTGHGALQTPLTRIKPDQRNIYFKFGDYLQALDVDTQKHTIIAAKWEQYYRQRHIDSSRISFSHLIFERNGDKQ
jgi:hypothetical protein